MTTLQVVVRAAPAGGRKPRPPWFTKWLSVLSVIRSAEAATDVDVSFTFICDGPVPDPVIAGMRGLGEIITLEGIGNSPSFRWALRHVTSDDRSDADLVYLVEDDWLHLEDALGSMAAALGSLPPNSYVSVYDNPDRYDRTDDLRTPDGPQVAIAGGRHWRRSESTNMSFCTRRATLRSDRIVMTAAASIRPYPLDRAMWRAVQGLGVRAPLRWVRGSRRLYTPVPSLGTHAELPYVAPLVDWAAVADEVRSWARSKGVAEEVGW